MSHMWSPSGKVFARRAMMLGAATFVVTFGLMMLWEPTRLNLLPFGLGLPLAITLFFVFDDAQRWRAVRNEVWSLEPPYLMQDGPDGRAMIALTEIKQVRTRLGTVILSLNSGQRIAMRYLPDPAAVVRHLNAARPG